MRYFQYFDNKRLDTPTGPIEYLIAGEGPPILYFHGTGAGNEVVPSMEQPLIDAGFRLIIPNRPGYYGTALTNRESAASCAKMAVELLDHLEVDKVAVIGTSGGGPPAARFASNFAERTSCLILQCAQSHRWDNGEWLPTGIRWVLPLFKLRWLRPLMRSYNKTLCLRAQGRIDDCIRRYGGARFQDVRNEQSLRKFVPYLLEASLICAQHPAGIENDWDILLDGDWLEPGSIRVPTLIIHDRRDPVVPFAHAEWSSQCVEHAELLEVKAAGHLIWYGEDADRMNSKRCGFIRTYFQSTNGGRVS